MCFATIQALVNVIVSRGSGNRQQTSVTIDVDNSLSA
jgi:hypothetical protein